MKTNVASSSREAYTDLKAEGVESTQVGRILASFEGSDKAVQWGFTRKEIAKKTGIDASDVGGRCNKMVKDGLLVEDPLEKRRCHVSGKRVKVLRLTPPNVQQEFF